MDIQQGFRLLMDWYKTSDNFCFSKNFRQLDWNSLGEDENKSFNDEDAKTCLEIALADMQENGMIKIAERGTGKAKEKVYVIVESMRNYPEEIILSKQTCDNVRRVVSGLLPMISLDYQYNEKDPISEEHVVLLLECINILSGQLSESMEKNKSLPKTSSNNELTSED